MPNRILKESICTSDNLDTLTPEQEVFFYRLITACDDYGCFDARPQIVKARCFPLKDAVTASIVDEWLWALQAAGLIQMYRVQRRRYLVMATWAEHQQIRAKRRKYPQPEDGELLSASNGYQMIADAGNSPRNPIQSESNPNPIQHASPNGADAPKPTKPKLTVVASEPTEPRELTASQQLFKALAGSLGMRPATTGERGAWNKAVSELHTADPPVRPEEIPKLVTAYRQMWPKLDITPTAIARHLGRIRQGGGNGDNRRDHPPNQHRIRSVEGRVPSGWNFDNPPETDVPDVPG